MRNHNKLSIHVLLIVGHAVPYELLVKGVVNANKVIEIFFRCFLMIGWNVLGI